MLKTRRTGVPRWCLPGLVAAFVGLVLAGSAMAHPNYNGASPTASGCSRDAQTVSDTARTVIVNDWQARVVARFSKRCDTAWYVVQANRPDSRITVTFLVGRTNLVPIFASKRQIARTATLHSPMAVVPLGSCISGTVTINTGLPGNVVELGLSDVCYVRKR